MESIEPDDHAERALRAVRDAEENAAHAAREEEASTWAEVNLGEVLDGDLEPE
jgi:hypothetical protein